MTCEHKNWIFKDGYKVCTDCGEIDDEEIQIMSYKNIEEENVVNIPQVKLSGDMKRRLLLDKHYGNPNVKWIIGEIWWVDQKIKQLINSFDLSNKVKKSLESYIRLKNPENNEDIIKSFLNYVKNKNLPITNAEIWNVIKELREGKVIFKEEIIPNRDYSFYIYKILSRFDFIKGEKMQQYYNIIKKQYDIVLNSRFSNIHKTKLIEALCYFFINKECKDVPKTERSQRHFNNITRPTVIKYRQICEELGII